MSLQNLLITKVVLPLEGSKRRYSSAERTRRHIAARTVRPARFAPPRGLERRADVSVSHARGWPVYDLSPRAGVPARHVLYLHGGAYVYEIVRWHWWMLGRFVKDAPCRCLVPIYPLAEALGAARTVVTATDIAADLIAEVGPSGVVLMGDSAGGGMALAVAQALRDRGLVPGRVVLISPWLDVATDGPEQQAIEPRDAMLAIPGLVESGRAYAGDLALDDPRVSPIHGELRGLPPITVFTSTEDLLNPDSHRLREACARAGVPCDLVEAAGMPHDWPLLPTPEGGAARRRIVELLRA
jgi:epsilon-lactone hydrolase